MEIHATNDFDASVPTVFTMLTDPEFLKAVCQATEPLEYSVSATSERTATRRVMTAPSVATRFTGPTIAVSEEITWLADDGSGIRHGEANISVDGMPAKLLGKVRLSPGGRGVLLNYDGDLSVDIPLIGPGLAKQAAPLLLEALKIQQQVGDQHLAAGK